MFAPPRLNFSSTIFLVGLMLLAQQLHARPLFVTLDVQDPEKSPAKYGYCPVATEHGDNVNFDILLDAKASSAFDAAHVFFLTAVKPEPKITVKVREERGLKTIHFFIAKRFLPDCVLHIDCVARKGDPVENFAGYRLRIDNIKVQVPEQASRPGK